MLYALLLAGGFAALIYGAGFLVDGASSFASRMRIPAIVIGLTVVALGTSAPELAINVFAALDKNPDIVLGNVLGSNILNVLLILGIAAIIRPLGVRRNTTWVEIPLCVLSAVAILILANDTVLDGTPLSVVSHADGFILLCFFLVFFAYNLHIARSGTTDEQQQAKIFSVAKSLLLVVLGAVLLVAGGRAIVYAAVEIAHKVGISDRIIALTVVSIGTSLPELATSVVAARKGNVDIAIGNAVGSNIFNAFLILGASAVIFPVSVPPMANSDMIVNVFASLLLFAFLFTGKGRQLSRWEGILFLSIYLGYIIHLVIGA